MGQSALSHIFVDQVMSVCHHMQCIPNVVAHAFNRNIFLHEHRLADDRLLVEMCTCNAKLN